MRPKHTVKTLVFFAPALSLPIHDIFNIGLFTYKTLLILIFFFLTHGIAYLMNDINDYEDDKHHPLKKNRPIASGHLRLKSAIYFLFFSTLSLILLSLFIGDVLIYYAVTYYINFIFYNYIGKKIIFLDGLTLLSMFIVRFYYGHVYYSIDIDLSVFVLLISVLSILIVKKRISEKNTSDMYRFSGCAFDYNTSIEKFIYFSGVIFVSLITTLTDCEFYITILYIALLTLIYFKRFKTDDLILEVYNIRYQMIFLLASYYYAINILL